jgi:hypothetical protein
VRTSIQVLWGGSIGAANVADLRRTNLEVLWRQTVNRKAGVPVKYTLLGHGLPNVLQGAVVQAVADVALSGNRVVRTTGASSVDYCDAENVLHRDTLLGITTSAASAGASVGVQTRENIDEASWSWVPGLPIFCGAQGVLTQTYNPLNLWAFNRIVGWALSATRMRILLREPTTI